MVVISACGTRGSAPQVAELCANSLQAAGGKSERGGQALRSSFRGHNRLDQHPGGAVGVGRVVEVKSVTGEFCGGPDRCRDRRRGAVRQRAPAGGSNHDTVVGFVDVERSRGPVGAGIVNGVGLIGFCTARHMIASQQQGRTRVTRDTDGRAPRSLQHGIVDSG